MASEFVDELAARRDQPQVPPEVVARLKSKHPNAELLELVAEDGTVVVVRTPNRGEYQRWRQLLLEPTTRHTANETLLLGCMVYPEEHPERMALLERRPGLGDVFGDKLAIAAGAGQDASQKKL